MNHCEQNGHNYHQSNVVYAKDSSGVAFRGGGAQWHEAAKYSVYVCGRCADTKEICVSPRLVIKPGAAPQVPEKDKQLQAPKGKPIFAGGAPGPAAGRR